MVDTNAILVGPEGTPFTITPGSAHTAFRQALDHLAGLSTNGGDLYVLPGTSKYVFGQKVVVGTGAPDLGVDNLTIHFSKGAILDFDPNASLDALFEVRRRGFRCIGAHVQHQSGNVTDRSCFLINDNGVAGASNDASFIDCTFDMEQAGNQIRAFSCIRAVGTGTAALLRRGLDVNRCVFLFRPGVRQRFGWPTLDPYGICAVRGRDSAEFTITGCQFRAHPFAGGGVGMCGPAIYLDQCDESVVSSCVFSSLDLKPVPGPQPASLLTLIRLRTQVSEAHHSILSANVFRAIEAETWIDLLDPQFEAVTGNVFGRPGSTAKWIVAAHPANPPSSNANTLVLVGNAFSDDPASPAEMVRLESIANVVAEGNVLSDLSPGKRGFVVEADCSNVEVSPNQARGTSD